MLNHAIFKKDSTFTSRLNKVKALKKINPAFRVTFNHMLLLLDQNIELCSNKRLFWSHPPSECELFIVISEYVLKGFADLDEIDEDILKLFEAMEADHLINFQPE